MKDWAWWAEASKGYIVKLCLKNILKKIKKVNLGVVACDYDINGGRQRQVDPGALWTA